MTEIIVFPVCDDLWGRTLIILYHVSINTEKRCSSFFATLRLTCSSLASYTLILTITFVICYFVVKRTLQWISLVLKSCAANHRQSVSFKGACCWCSHVWGRLSIQVSFLFSQRNISHNNNLIIISSIKPVKFLLKTKGDALQAALFHNMKVDGDSLLKFKINTFI